MLNDLHRQMLSESARDVMKGRHDGADNPELERVIELIKKANPEKFHTDETLRDRKFYDEPRPFVAGRNWSGIRNRGFVRHAPPDAHRSWE